MRVWLGMLCACLLTFAAQAAEIQVGVDRNPVSLNESFEITFSASDTPDGSPDFSPLQGNFEILNQQRSSNMSWVNGKSSRNEQWTLSVMPKQTGELLIPPIAFGADISKPIKVTVTDAPPAQPGNTDDIFLEVRANPEKPYVQSQVLYTLKLYRRVQITQASLNEPEIKDALVEKLGEDSTYSTQINGMDYWVTERKYAIFPQQSGLFTIAPLTLTAEVVGPQHPRFNGFFNRQATETRRISSNPVTLNVQPVPADFTDPAWLSAESLTLTESWSDSRLQTKVGEPLTRTITLTAKGATVGQLPELIADAGIDGVKTYPDQPVLKEDKQNDGLIAIRTEKIAYIPSQPGQYILPARTISWFNTKTQKTETAQLPEVTILALAVAGGQPATAEAPSPEQSAPFQPDAGDAAWFWQGLSGFLALGWMTTALWFYRRSRQQTPPATRKQKPLRQPDEQKALRTACRQNNPHAAKQALLQWGKQQFAVDNLASIAQECPASLRDEIVLLNQCLYSDTHAEWNGQALWQAFGASRAKQTASQPQDQALEPLYRL